MKNHLKGSHFENVEDIQKFRMAVPNNMQQNNFRECSEVVNGGEIQVYL
jgi:hypothetical protein